jgi:hypothetical protein
MSSVLNKPPVAGSSAVPVASSNNGYYDDNDYGYDADDDDDKGSDSNPKSWGVVDKTSKVYVLINGFKRDNR